MHMLVDGCCTSDPIHPYDTSEDYLQCRILKLSAPQVNEYCSSLHTNGAFVLMLLLCAIQCYPEVEGTLPNPGNSRGHHPIDTRWRTI